MSFPNKEKLRRLTQGALNKYKTPTPNQTGN